MADGFFPPVHARLLDQQNTFSQREVGVTHPDTPGFIRLTDKGDIQIMADDGLGIIINYKHKSITLMANTIRFITTDNEGLAWNTNFFNSNATVYNQPTLNPSTGANVANVYDGAHLYYNKVGPNNTSLVSQMELPGFDPNAPQPSEEQLPSSQAFSGTGPYTAPSNPNTESPNSGGV